LQLFWKISNYYKWFSADHYQRNCGYKTGNTALMRYANAELKLFKAIADIKAFFYISLQEYIL